MQHLIEIFPSWIEWARWLVLFTAGYVLRIIYKAVESDMRKQRRRKIRAHVHEKHTAPLRRCMQGECPTLRPADQAHSDLPGMAAADLQV